jgi:hypothetical protein
MVGLLVQSLFKDTMEAKGMMVDQQEVEVLLLLEVKHLQTLVLEEGLVELHL